MRPLAAAVGFGLLTTIWTASIWSAAIWSAEAGPTDAPSTSVETFVQGGEANSHRALVVPFDGAGTDPRLVWLGEGVATLVADGLTTVGRPTYTHAERARIFEEMGLPARTRLSYATTVRVAEVLGARVLVTGTIELEDERLAVHVRRLDVPSGRADAEIVEEGPVSDLFLIAERVVRRVSNLPGTAAISQASGPDRPPPLDAFESYIKGLVAESPATRVKFLEATLARHPGYPRAELALWEVYTERQDHARALRAAEAVSPDSQLARRARFLAARSLLALERYDDAFEALHTLLTEQPTAPLYNALGIVQLRREAAAPEDRAATEYFNKAAQAEPENPDFFFNLGYASWLERDTQAAIYWLREVVRRNPADGEAHLVLAAALQASGRPAEAARERELARQLSARYAPEERQDGAQDADAVPRGLERVHDELEGIPPHALNSVVVKASQQEHADLADFHRDRGQRFFAEQQNREAIVELRKAAYLEPYDAVTQLWLGQALTRAGRLREAIDSLKISIWSQDTAAARVALATAFVESGDPAGAREHVEHALRLEPESPEATALLERLRSQAPPRP